MSASCASGRSVSRLRHHLSQQVVSDGDLSGEGPIVRGDEQDGYGDSRGEETHRHRGGATALHVHDGDRAVRSALASRLIAALACSMSPKTSAARKATKRPKMIPRGGSMPGERPLNRLARPPADRSITAAKITAAIR